jgi:pimeloyl-ACP methyl ester carboxylesterase
VADPGSRRLGRIAAPTLLVWGDQDALAPVECADDVASGLADARKLVVPGPGHMVPLEAYEEVSASIDRFVGS